MTQNKGVVGVNRISTSTTLITRDSVKGNLWKWLRIVK